MIAEPYAGTGPEQDALQVLSGINAGEWKATRDNASGLHADMSIALQYVFKDRDFAAALHPIRVAAVRNADTFCDAYIRMRVEHAQGLWFLELHLALKPFLANTCKIRLPSNFVRCYCCHCLQAGKQGDHPC
jgi:hypothetical protein